MSEIALHPTGSNCITCVPDYFIDEYMAEANGEYVKIYLYILRSLSRTTSGFSISKIADDLDHTQKDVKKALRYWEKAGLLNLEYDDDKELCGIYLKDPTIEDSIDYFEDSDFTPGLAPVLVQPAPSVLETNHTVDKDLQEVLYLAEKLLNHPLSSNNVERIIFWHDSMNFDWDLVEYIIETSCDNANGSFSYMETMASNYAKEGVRTVEQAKEMTNAYLSVNFAVKRAFGISGRMLGNKEIEFVNRWTREYGFSSEIIIEACNRTLLKLNNPSFDYTDSILSNWYNSGVKSIDDIAVLDERHVHSKNSRNSKTKSKASFKNFPERDDYDYKELETKLLQS